MNKIAPGAETTEKKLSVCSAIAACSALKRRIIFTGFEAMQPVRACGKVTLSRLPFGIYTLTVSSERFASRSELVDVRSALPRIVRSVLTVAPIATSVTVGASSTLVDAHSPGVAHAIGSQQLREQQCRARGGEDRQPASRPRPDEPERNRVAVRELTTSLQQV